MKGRPSTTAAPKMAFEPTAAVSYACFSYLPRLWPFAMLQTLRQATWRDAMFSLKTFIAAMLALFIAFRLNLSQPSWSVTTVYIVSQPFSGMVLAKSLYRMLGTVIGAVMSLLLVAL